MLSTSTINPAVIAAAELFTDGALTDAVLAGVASMKGLPLFVTVQADAGPSAADRAATVLAEADAELRASVRRYNNALDDLRAANRRTAPPLYRGAKPTARALSTVRRMQSQAMAALNRARASVNRAGKAQDAARASLAAVVS